MKTVNITVPGAIIESARTRIPELAKVTLDKFANNKFKEMKLVTKAFRYQFPFYDSLHRKRAFAKFFVILEKALEQNIPYIKTAKVDFLTVERESTDNIIIRIGPANDTKLTMILQKYVTKLITKTVANSLPLHIYFNKVSYVKPKRGSNGYVEGYATREEQAENTFDIHEIKVKFMTNVGEGGYLMLLYAEYFLKVLETLHRKAHYADSTHRAH